MLKMALAIGLIQKKKRISKDRPRYALNQVTNIKKLQVFLICLQPLEQYGIQLCKQES